MGTERGMDRLIFFTDAVTAIAITLLILPLVELVPEASTHKGDAIGDFFRDNLYQIFAFVLSFVIIARQWLANHEILEHVVRPTPRLFQLNLAWAFTVVVLPLPTEIVAAFVSNAPVIAFYIGTMTVNSLILSAICVEVYRHPETEDDGNHGRLERLVGSLITTAAFVIALILSLTVPRVNYYALLVLVLTIPAYRLIKPRLRRYEKEHSS
jgi:uncharacterized membrane protein